MSVQFGKKFKFGTYKFCFYEILTSFLIGRPHELLCTFPKDIHL